MAELNISMKLDNAAMTEDEEGITPDGRAVADILRNLGASFADGLAVGSGAKIRDANGNTIGAWTCTP